MTTPYLQSYDDALKGRWHKQPPVPSGLPGDADERVRYRGWMDGLDARVKHDLKRLRTRYVAPHRAIRNRVANPTRQRTRQMSLI